MTPDEELLSKIKRSFDDDGIIILRGYLSSGEVDRCRKQWDSMREDLANGRIKNGLRRDGFYIHGRFAAPIGDIPSNPRLLNVAKVLLNSENIAVYLSRINIKDRQFSEPIHLHQDIPYFNGATRKIGAFVALKKINLNNGAMVFVPGSQKLGITDRSTLDVGLHSDLDVIIPSLVPGDVVFTDIKLWHASVPNSSGEDRPLLQTVYQPASDGSYYPDSIGTPWLVAGEWETNDFSPWKPITASTCYHDVTYVRPSPIEINQKSNLLSRLRSYIRI